MKKKRPPKIENLLDKIKECIRQNMYTQVPHALVREEERKITLPETIYVLLTGYEEKAKTRFEEKHNAWNYAIRGKTKIDEIDVRVIVSFDESDMLIITVIDIEGGL